jgi:hypothetical protein
MGNTDKSLVRKTEVETNERSRHRLKDNIKKILKRCAGGCGLVYLAPVRDQ